MNNFDRPYTLDRVIRMILGSGVLIGLYLLINRLSGVLIYFMIGWLIAYMLNPLVGFFQYKMRLKRRVPSILLAILTVLGTIFGLIAILVPPIIGEIQKMSQLLQQYNASPSGYLPFIPVELQEFIFEKVNLKELGKYLNKEDWEDLFQEIFPRVWGIFSNSLSWLFGLFASSITILYIFFILVDYDKIGTGFIKIIPPAYKERVSVLVSDLERNMNSYFRGQAAVASIVGVLFAIGFSILGLPLAILLGLFIGLLNMVPYLQTIGIIPTALVCFIKSAESGQSFWALFGLALGVFAVVQLIQDAIIVPRIMGKITGLNPAIILLALSIWGSLLGMLGMIIALPMTTLIISYYDRFVLEENKPITSIDKKNKQPIK
ncbi:MAG: AI-2E family transporter [Bacteroidales bacterium]